MKPKAKVLLTCLFSVLIVSCDPPHYIDFVNISKSNAKVKLNINPKTENYDLRRIAIGDSIVFNLKPKDTANIDFGIGNWSDKEIDFIVYAEKDDFTISLGRVLLIKMSDVFNELVEVDLAARELPVGFIGQAV